MENNNDASSFIYQICLNRTPTCVQCVRHVNTFIYFQTLPPSYTPESEFPLPPLVLRSFINRWPPTPSRWSRSRFRLTIAERSGRDRVWASNSVIELQGDVEGALETVERSGGVGDRGPRVHPRERRLRGTRNWGMTGFLKGPSDVLIFF